MYFNPLDPTHWFALYVGTLYGMAQTFYGIGTGPEVTHDRLGRFGRAPGHSPQRSGRD